MEQTARIVEAIRHPAVKILTHPAADRYGRREPIDVDWDVIFDECVRNNVALEISGHPKRVGYPALWLWKAKQAGVKFT